MLTVDFHEVACAAISRGFAVIPLRAGGKEPQGVGALARSRDPKQIAAWAEQRPDANVGFCSDDQITILESDNEQQFRQLIRDVSRSLLGGERELPTTLTSQARPNRPHFFFRATPRTCSVEGSPAIQGLFEWRRENQYVVGAGSLHPSGVKYQYTNDAAIVPFPDWLVDVLAEIRRAYRGDQNRASKFVRVGPAAIAKDALIGKYVLDVDAMISDDEFTLQVDAGERHYFLQSMAGLLHDGTRSEEQLASDLRKLNERYCADGGKSEHEIDNLAAWTCRREPSSVEPLLPADDRVTVGSLSAPVGRKSADDFSYKRPRVEGRRREYVLEALNTFDGWFPRGACSIIAGTSGSGKSTLMLDLLHRQRGGDYFLGHRGAKLPYLVIFADRGHLANEETLERMGLLDQKVPIAYMSSSAYDLMAADNIKDLIEEENEIPQAVFVEGADLLVSDPNATPEVGGFVLALQRIAEHYHIAVVFSCGSPKTNKNNEPTQRRDRVFGSQAWARTCCTIAVLTTEDDGTTQYRNLTVQHRNAPTETFALEFQGGHLVEVKAAAAVTPEGILLEWAKTAGTFTRQEALEMMKEAGADITKKSLNDQIARLVKGGKLAEGFVDNKVILRVAGV